LCAGVGVAGIDNMHDDIRLAYFLQSGAKRLHKLVGQIPHKTHCVCQREGTPRGSHALAYGRIQGGKEGVFDQNPRLRHAVKQ
jgi:hypothetical protein